MSTISSGLAPNQHTGHRLSHRHTSYAALIFLLLLMAVVTASWSYTSSGSTVISARIDGPPPTIPPVITSPLNGSAILTSPMVIKGSCVDGTFVSLLRNGAFSGSTYCGGGNFEITTDLSLGANQLVAQGYYFSDELGPNSLPVNVTYRIPAPLATPLPQHSGSNQTPVSVGPLLLATSVPTYQGAQVGEPLSWQFIIAGGTAPYRVRWDWGDGKVDLLERSSSGSLTNQHVYAKGGIYHVVVTVTDSTGQTSLLQVVVQVNGSGAVVAAPTKPNSLSNHLNIFWMVFAAATLMVASFWLGEKYKGAPTMVPTLQ